MCDGVHADEGAHRMADQIEFVELQAFGDLEDVARVAQPTVRAGFAFFAEAASA